MFPDNTPAGQSITPSTPATLPQVDFQAAAAQPTPPPASPGAPGTPAMPSEQDSAETLQKLQQLTAQYGNNPYAFNAAFQQLKARYLLDHYHIDPNTEKN